VRARMAQAGPARAAQFSWQRFAGEVLDSLRSAAAPSAQASTRA
jgi:hypothetical protein